MRHKDIAIAYNHVAHNWEYADATARGAATGFVSGDLKKLALQLDDYSLWILTAVTPTWEPAGGSAGSVTATGSLTANAVMLGNGGVDTKVAAGLTTDGTSRLQLGVAGTSVGGVELRNATSGTISLVPVTGALGTTVLTLPAGTDTITGIAATQTLTNKTLVAPALGTPASGVLTNCTGLPVATGVSGLGSNVGTFLATPTFTNLAAAVTGATLFASTTMADVLEAALFAADAGSTDAYAITLSPAITAYVTGAHYRFKANTANTGAATIDINAVGAKTIKKAAGGITTDLATDDIRAGQWVDLVYDGTNMQMQSTLGNAASGSDTQVQFNDGGAFGGDAGLVYNKTTDKLTNLTGGIQTGGSFLATGSTSLGGVAGVKFGYDSGVGLIQALSAGSTPLPIQMSTTNLQLYDSNGASSVGLNADGSAATVGLNISGKAEGIIAFVPGVGGDSVQVDMKADTGGTPVQSFYINSVLKLTFGVAGGLGSIVPDAVLGDVALRVAAGGNFLVNTNGYDNADFAVVATTGQVLAKASIASTTKDTGALVVTDGGLGVEGAIFLGGAITTGAPLGGTAGAWKGGIRVAATVVLDTTQYIQLDVGGTLYKLGIVS